MKTCVPMIFSRPVCEGFFDVRWLYISHIQNRVTVNDLSIEIWLGVLFIRP